MSRTILGTSHLSAGYVGNYYLNLNVPEGVQTQNMQTLHLLMHNPNPKLAELRVEEKAQLMKSALNPEMQHEENAKITTLFVLGGFDVNTKQIQEECEPKRRPLMSSVFRGKFIISENTLQNVSANVYSCFLM